SRAVPVRAVDLDDASLGRGSFLCPSGPDNSVLGLCDVESLNLEVRNDCLRESVAGVQAVAKNVTQATTAVGVRGANRRRAVAANVGFVAHVAAATHLVDRHIRGRPTSRPRVVESEYLKALIGLVPHDAPPVPAIEPQLALRLGAAYPRRRREVIGPDQVRLLFRTERLARSRRTRRVRPSGGEAHDREDQNDPAYNRTRARYVSKN